MTSIAYAYLSYKLQLRLRHQASQAPSTPLSSTFMCNFFQVHLTIRMPYVQFVQARYSLDVLRIERHAQSQQQSLANLGLASSRNHCNRYVRVPGKKEKGNEGNVSIVSFGS